MSGVLRASFDQIRINIRALLIVAFSFTDHSVPFCGHLLSVAGIKHSNHGAKFLTVK